MPTSPTTIAALPATPDRADRATFSPRATALFDAIKATWQPELQSVANVTYNNAVEAAAAAVASSASADAAANSALIASGAANYKGNYAAGTTYTVGQSVTYGTSNFVAKKTNLGITPVNGNDWLEIIFSQEIITPSNVSPASGATGVIDGQTFTGSTFYGAWSAAQTAIQVQVHTSNSFTAPMYSSGDQPAATSFALPGGTLSVSTTYWWRLRYKNARGFYSDWSAPTSFTTAAQFTSYIPTPTATPANFGDALEGGFYAGMVWEQLTQSATSTTIGTGSKTFTVPSMVGAPIVYAGQTVEVRSRTNPANKMVGTVTNASGTSLTISVSSVGGSGTFSDWSVMARFRIIVAPKASGENTGIALKNANSAFPTACQTLTEGLAATQAMRDADTSTVYPAAHWARNLNIGGRTDWYIPARDELELCWRNLKPVTDNNYTAADRPTGQSFNYATSGSYGDTANTHGANNNSSPPGAAYTTTVPAQTAAIAFRAGGVEAFEFGSAYYWSSSEYSASNAWLQGWYSSLPGYQYNNGKSFAYRVRAVRRSVI